MDRDHANIKETPTVTDPQEALLKQLASQTSLAQEQQLKIASLEEEIAELKKTQESLEAKSDILVQLAQYDKLTNLYNRTSLEDRLSWLLNLTERNQQQLAVALLDLDNFKEINDAFGHKIGDTLLKVIAARIQKSARKVDTIGRLGGDEFAIIITNAANQSITYEILQRVICEVAKPVELEGREFEITCSIGFSLYPQDGSNAETLLKHADTAMYQAKQKGRGHYQYFSAELQRKIQARVKMEDELKQAIKLNQFVLEYQPQMDMRSGKLVGFEALVRWQHPEDGLLAPTSFISLAEETNLILPIGEWVFRSVCEQLAEWQVDQLPLVPISVNLSVRQLAQADIVEQLKAILQQNSLDAEWITLEITESLSLDENKTYSELICQLKELGFNISIDDFGTGFSNLNYLKAFPIDEIKIDREFVKEIVSNPHDLAIATTIIAIAHNLGFKVVAEGIEDRPQLTLLAKHGCDILQGFYFSPSLGAEQASQLLQSEKKLSLEGIRQQNYKRTLLFVDDEANILSALRRVFRRQEIQVLTAGSALEALELMALHEIGVIVSDLSMPKVNGVELLDKINHMYPDTVRMMLSGKGEFELACAAINRSAIHKFIIKPWSDRYLIKEVEDAFQVYESKFQTNVE